MEARRQGPIFWIFVGLFTLAWMSPILASILTSIKSYDEILRGQYWTLPEVFQFSNYVEAFTKGRFGNYFMNSFYISIPSVVFIMLFSAFNGYVIAKLRIPGTGFLYYLFLAGMLLPFQILLIPVYWISNQIGTYDTIWGLILFHTAFQLGFGSFFMANFIKTLPTSLIESARIDGCNEAKIFFKVILPLTKPALAALSTLMFTWIWNDYLWALIMIQSDELKPITSALQDLQGRFSQSIHLQSSGAVIAAIPAILVFAFLQKHLVKGLTMGSTK